MGRARKIVDEADARRCMLAAKQAGQSVGKWAPAHGIDGRSLHAWQVNLDRRRPAALPTERVPELKPAAHALVELVSTAPATAAVAPSRARYVVEVGGARVEFGDDVSVDTLRRVVGALRSC